MTYRFRLLPAVLFLCACSDDPRASAPDGSIPDDASATAGSTGGSLPPPDGGVDPCHAGFCPEAFPDTRRIRAVWADPSIDRLWAVGDDGLVARREAGEWVVEASVPDALDADLHGLWGSGTDDVWAVGQAGVILRWQGAEWTVVEVADPTFCGPALCRGNLEAVWGDGTGTVYAVGASHDLKPVISRWDGAAFTHRELDASGTLRAIWGSSPTDVWVAGAFGLLFHGDGTDAWDQHTIPDRLPAFAGLWGSSGDDVWAVADSSAIYHWGGTAWEAERDPIVFSDGEFTIVRAVWGASAHDVWAVGGAQGTTQTILHYDGQAWSRPVQRMDTPELTAVTGAGGRVIAIGAEGTVLMR
ncbi:hypothetical protein [Sorangium sp. So ce341]|uniref:sialidase family protein n=1 Tax=Sorangium sp. So ce341 TaxID=3133302 RepID=UPI003F5DA3B8